jgi:predicted nucleic acid-binding protein
MGRVLLDTDVLIDHLRGHRKLDLTDAGLQISIVTRCELFAGRHVDETRLRRTLEQLPELPLDRALVERAGRVRRETGLHVPDALIAATALVHQLPLMTRNRRHFERVSGLVIHDPPTRSRSAQQPADIDE